MKNNQVMICINGIQQNIPIGTYLSDILQQQNDFPMPCAGHGRCGKCKVWVEGTISEPNEKEQNYLTKQELENGIRLACQTKVLGSCNISSIKKDTIDVLLQKEMIQNTFLDNQTTPMFQSAI